MWGRTRRQGPSACALTSSHENRSRGPGSGSRGRTGRYPSSGSACGWSGHSSRGRATSSGAACTAPGGWAASRLALCAPRVGAPDRLDSSARGDFERSRRCVPSPAREGRSYPAWCSVIGGCSKGPAPRRTSGSQASRTWWPSAAATSWWWQALLRSCCRDSGLREALSPGWCLQRSQPTWSRRACRRPRCARS